MSRGLLIQGQTMSTRPELAPASHETVLGVLASLSLATDLANDHPIETALRTSILAARLAQELGLTRIEISDAFYTGLMRYLGCTSFAVQEAELYGDDIAVRKLFMRVELESPVAVARAATSNLARGRGFATRTKALLRAASCAHSYVPQMRETNCEAGRLLATRMQLGASVAEALGQLFERVDGNGGPHGLGGEAIRITTRITQVAAFAVLSDQVDGPELTIELLQRGRGTRFDAAVVDALVRARGHLLGRAENPPSWEEALEKVAPLSLAVGTGLVELAEGFADCVDLKSRYTVGHSRGVAHLAVGAARRLGLSQADCTQLHLAGLLHDLGVLSIPTGILDKPGPLTASEWERVRVHSYWSERVLLRSPALAPVAPIVTSHHERLEGSGYPKGEEASRLSIKQRILAAAEVVRAMLEHRAHRAEPHTLDAVAAVVEDEVKNGKLDHQAAAAVMETAGHPWTLPRVWPGDLSDREVEVLRLLARAMSNKEIGAELSISSRTVGHHVAHIYQKIGVTTRVGAALFACQNDLLPVNPG